MQRSSTSTVTDQVTANPRRRSLQRRFTAIPVNSLWGAEDTLNMRMNRMEVMKDVNLQF